MAARHSRKFLRPLLYTSAAAAAGAGVIYISYRPRNIPGLEAPAVPPPGYYKGKLVPPSFPSIKSRLEQIEDLKRSEEEEEYDLLVIGAGATGAGIALDAATRGLKVAVVERDDFSSGTSSKSTKLVHGGVRYLEKAVWELDYNQYALVKEALRERKYFLNTAPHLSSWLPIMVPVQKWWQAPYFWAGTKAYDFLAGSEGIETSYFLTKSKAIDAFPMLKRDNIIGAMVYYDGAHNDSRMNVSLAMTAALYGTTVVNHLEVTGLNKDASGRLCGARAKDIVAEKNGEVAKEFNIRAKGVINATGPFSDSIRKMDEPNVKEIVAPSAGVHIILPGYFSPSNMGLIDPSTSDGRVIFFLPWQGNTIAGTTDQPCEIEAQPQPTEKDINWILSEIRGYIAPDITVDRSDVLAAWSGIRPLVRDPKVKNSEALVRNHLVTVSQSGLLTCAGGKWTTYRQMAEEAVDEAVKSFKLKPRQLTSLPDISGVGGSGLVADGAVLDGSCQTHQVRLIGAHGYSKTLFINLIQHFGLETDVAKHLTESYGDRSWQVAALSSPTSERFPVRGCRISPMYPFVDGEIRYAVRHEYAQTAVDVIARRTRLAFLNAEAALESLPTVIDTMAEELKWTNARKDLEWKDSLTFLSSMGLPKSFMGLSRHDVQNGRVTQVDDAERATFSRKEPPADMIESDSDIDLQSLRSVKRKLDPENDSVVPKPDLEESDPFGDESQSGVKYKTMAWWQDEAYPFNRQAGMIMIAETISLGILALPKALAVLGLVPGILTILGVGIISTYTAYTIGRFKCRHVQVHSMADAGDLLMGRVGRTTLDVAQLVFFVLVMGSHILTFSIMMNVLTEHSSCTIVFSVVGLLASFMLTLPRRLERLSHISSVSFVSIVGAVLTGMIGVTLVKQGPVEVPAFSPPPKVHDACLAIANIIFAYAGHVAFFTLFSELKELKDFPKALALLQMSEMVLYTVASIVIYAYVGPTVNSPALNSSGQLFRKISYAIALPTILIGGVVNAHVAVKFIYVRVFRGTNSMHTQSFRARVVWTVTCAGLWILSWIIAEAIPVFNDVLGLASSLFASWFSFGLPGLFWLYLNRTCWYMTWRQRAFFGFNLFLVFLGFVICIVGLYSSIRSIFNNLREGVGGGSFSCADNSLY
ncbi:Glycerol-3-phosphate dehydrogenase mitochondrial [Penicillium psychrosexuale]|uniref:Glycerol-3-phosphate dehydrogenase mitochondrial n=1 Tax=Penicillium psychrosexuale TaxID=1002107 RepID=UPI0025459471|nr:Glycerol-3-phosphate dehydrogenase mitochondrial [Penicillium psychrosexuale]KAJ5799140.1 Glycerol-3-phosphate dehydrogenase mitochondrial [Penicillium psychrosexuale]